MKIREFLKIMKRRNFNKINGFGNGYNFTKNNERYFISKYEIICIYDISNFNIENFNFNKDYKPIGEQNTEFKKELLNKMENKGFLTIQ